MLIFPNSRYFCNFLLLKLAHATAPWPMTWSPKTFGPDGPWYALSIPIGWPNEQTVALYPGGAFQSHIISIDICDSVTNTSACYENPAGLYNICEAANTATENSIDGFRTDTDFTLGGLNITGTQPISFLDNVDIGGHIINNVSMTLQSDGQITYPDGLQIPLTIGSFALGGPGQTTQSFGNDFTGNLIPGFLFTEASSDIATSSNSYGLHIGSALLGIPPSLYFGGFDQTRLLGNLSTQIGSSLADSTTASALLIDLVDVSLTVSAGASPWTFDSMDGLLASGNDSVGAALQVEVRSVSPYLNLPQSTCDAIAAQLPVTYQPYLGLYFWNTNDPLYSKIVSSPACLSFTFRKNQLNDENLTIHVPFMLLNLNLEVPLVNMTTSYFPCNAQSRGNYQLGRAFLQAAFVGVNWHIDNNVATWWLGQAPGPNTPSQAVVQSITDTDTTINASTNSWVDSWSTSWKVLTYENSAPKDNSANATSATLMATSSSVSGNAMKKASLSVRAKAGIGAACAVLVLVALVAVAVFFLLRKKAALSVMSTSLEESYAKKIRLEVQSVKELDCKPIFEMPELETHHTIAELDTGDDVWKETSLSHQQLH